MTLHSEFEALLHSYQPAITAYLCNLLGDEERGQELAAHCASNGLRYASENFSFDKMMEAKLRADLAVLRKKQGGESASRC